MAQTAHFSGALKMLGSGFSYPVGVAVDASGNVFVADYDDNAVKEIVAAGGYTTVNTLGSGFSGPTGVAVDAAGNVFVADYGNNAVKEIAYSGGSYAVTPVTLGSGFSGPYGVAVDASDNVYVADFYNNAVKEITAASSYTAVIPLVTGLSEPTDVALDANGDIFIANYGGDAVDEVVYSGGSYSAPVALGSGFEGPYGVAVDSNGNVYVADFYNSAVKEITAASSYATVTTLGSGLIAPRGVAVDAKGNLFIADDSGVWKLWPNGVDLGTVNVGSTGSAMTLTFTFDAGGAIATPLVLTQGAANLDFTDVGTGTCTTNGAHEYIAGDTCTVNVQFSPKHPGIRYGAAVLTKTGGAQIASGYLYGVGDGPQAIFSSNDIQSVLGSGFTAPEGVAVDGAGNVFVADPSKAAVYEIVAAGGYTTVNTLGGSFSTPTGVAVDGAGNVFVADNLGNSVKEILAAGGYTTVNTLGSGFQFPLGVAVDGSGNVFVVDDNSVVKEIPAAGGYANVKTLPASFIFIPGGVALDGAGNVFVTDDYDNVVDEIPAAGGYASIQTLGGSFSSPNRLAVDGSGNVFVADYGNNAVKEILAAGGYTTVETLGSGFSGPRSVAVDGSGNVFVADAGNNAVKKLDYSDPPSLSFATTTAYQTSSDSPQTVTVANDGNQNLTFSQIAYATDFPEGSGVATDCSTSTPVSGGNSCTLTIDFTPLGPSATGASTGLNETVVLTDNNLNASPNTTQSVTVAGTETAPPPFGAEDMPEDVITHSSTITQGDGVLLTGWAADYHDGAPVNQVAILVDGSPAGYATLGLSRSGVAVTYGPRYLDSGWTFTYSGSLTAGTHTIGAVIYDAIGLSKQLPTHSFTVSSAPEPPFGAMDVAADATTLRTPVSQADGLLVKGWAGDFVLGAPISQVVILLDGTQIGTATLGIADPSVVTSTGDASLLNSGWSFTYTGAALTAGPHSVSAVAYDTTSGLSATIGTASIQVQANPAPFGGMTPPVDAVTKSSTVTQGDGVLVTGWAADVTDGAPIHQVSILIDGNPVGNATLGIAHPGTATIYGSRYLDSGWTYTYTGSLTAGSHTIAAVFYDSLGLSTQLSARTFTVSGALAPPFGALSETVDAITHSNPVGQSDGLLVTGWAADLVQGAPVSQVTIFLNGTPVGNATLGIADPAVVASTGNSAYLNSGWTFTDASLTNGTYTVSAVAYDSGGRSATLGSQSVTVQANAPPFGLIGTPLDASTNSTTIAFGDSVAITGWAADVHDGAPVSQVAIFVDCTPGTVGCTAAGTATLGLKKPGVATEFGSRYLYAGWSYTYTGTLSTGTHTITAVFTDSLSLTKQTATRTFTVSP